MKKSDIKIMPQYFDRYINLIDDIELSQAFDNSIKQLDELDTNLLAKLDGKTYEPGKWTVKDIFQHIIDWERIFTFRTLMFARKETTPLPGIDETILGANMNTEHRKAVDMVAELKAVRLSAKALFTSFDDKTLQNIGINWQYETPVLAMGFIMVGHQAHHLNVIEKKYYSLVSERQ